MAEQDENIFRDIRELDDKFIGKAVFLLNSLLKGELIAFSETEHSEVVFIAPMPKAELEETRASCELGRAIEFLGENRIDYLLCSYVFDYINSLRVTRPELYLKNQDKLVAAITRNAFIVRKGKGLLTNIKTLLEV